MSATHKDGHRIPTQTEKTIGQNLRQLRKMKGLSQTELGQQIGVSFQQVQKYEKAKNRLSIGTLLQCAKVLQIDLEAFLAGTDHAPGDTIQHCDQAFEAANLVDQMDEAGRSASIQILRNIQPKFALQVAS